eukprot:TRINITY_DN43552_c0_g1_i3.p1 TRINITY_DN43552_c0_g1~~TRINITY_DN43552_c0_g1_i3.p1  ORF type:complete len:271 (-),score=19.58 TRINITY_DN43552_c0_g1_i3:11-748(-)
MHCKATNKGSGGQGQGRQTQGNGQMPKNVRIVPVAIQVSSPEARDLLHGYRGKHVQAHVLKKVLEVTDSLADPDPYLWGTGNVYCKIVTITETRLPSCSGPAMRAKDRVDNIADKMPYLSGLLAGAVGGVAGLGAGPVTAAAGAVSGAQAGYSGAEKFKKEIHGALEYCGGPQKIECKVCKWPVQTTKSKEHPDYGLCQSCLKNRGGKPPQNQRHNLQSAAWRSTDARHVGHVGAVSPGGIFVVT